ncbi:MAG TPA: hypothetical protein VN767_04265 [Streptosporangiaceae bacterium]|nr:hypothetical protein [Streptosporangiaceae bacterium]
MTHPETPADHLETGQKPPRWQLTIRPDGTLAAETQGRNPPLTVTGDTLASLRRKTRAVSTPPEQA